jgi:hypothetical protein
MQRKRYFFGVGVTLLRYGRMALGTLSEESGQKFKEQFQFDNYFVYFMVWLKNSTVRFQASAASSGR